MPVSPRLQFRCAATACALLLTPVVLAAPAVAYKFGDAPFSTRPDEHAPIGVMGDHMHKAGQWMLSYRYMHMEMKGNQAGSNDVSTADILADYMVAPRTMDMDMHMIGGMYAPTDWITLMAMTSYVSEDMDLITRMGMPFSTSAGGWGDTSVGGNILVFDTGSQHVHLNAGVSLPTGHIGERDDTPAMADARLPYRMQTGSGTWDLLPGITYTGHVSDLSWGAQIKGVVRLGHNDHDYRLGDRVDATTWVARPLARWVSGSLRMAFTQTGDIHGADPALNPMMAPTLRPDLQRGSHVNAYAGLNFLLPEGPLKGNRLAVEVGMPVYQHLDGPQMADDWSLTIGWQKAFE